MVVFTYYLLSCTDSFKCRINWEMTEIEAQCYCIKFTIYILVAIFERLNLMGVQVQVSREIFTYTTKTLQQLAKQLVAQDNGAFPLLNY